MSFYFQLARGVYLSLETTKIPLSTIHVWYGLIWLHANAIGHWQGANCKVHTCFNYLVMRATKFGRHRVTPTETRLIINVTFIGRV